MFDGCEFQLTQLVKLIVVEYEIYNPFGFMIYSSFLPFPPLRLRLEGGNGMEWKGIKRIILEYSSLLCLGVLMEGMESPFPCLGV